MTQRPPLRPGEPAPSFTLPAVMQPGSVSLADYRGKSAVLVGFFRGLHCPFCRRQIFQLSAIHDTLAQSGVFTLAVVNTEPARAAIYFRYHPASLTLLADPDARTHALFGVPSVVLDETFAAARINPTGELPAPVHPMEANSALNALDRFELTPVDEAVFAKHGAQLVGHFLIDRHGIVRWTNLEAAQGVQAIGVFPSATEILAAARNLNS